MSHDPTSHRVMSAANTPIAEAAGRAVEIIRALELLFQPGDVFEIRVLDAERASYRRPHVESGYFDYEHRADVPRAMAEIATAAGVYTTINPVDPALLARAANRLVVARRNQSAGNADVLRRRWLFIDIDPVRPAGISATDAEKTLAFDRTMEMREGLASMGWPQPVVVDSGNGCYLLYRIDLPSGDNGLVQRCLQALQPLSDGKVHIDLSVANAARICRLPGTWNRKGDDMPDRPHRMAAILDAPEATKTVPTALLEALAAQVPTEAPTRPAGQLDASAGIQGARPGDAFNERGEIAPVLQAHGWQRMGASGENELWRRPGKSSGNHSATFNGQSFYVFSANAAPFEPNRAYSPFSVYTLLTHNGDYETVARALRTSGYGCDPDSDIHPGVDISGIMQSIAMQKQAVSEPRFDGYDDGPSVPRENLAKEQAFRRAFVEEARRIVRDWTAPPETDTSDPLGETEAARKLRVRVRERFAIYERGDAGPKTCRGGYLPGHAVPAARLRGRHHAMVFVTEPWVCPGWPDFDILDTKRLGAWLLAVERWAAAPIQPDRIVPPPRPFEDLRDKAPDPRPPTPATEEPPATVPTPPQPSRRITLTRADQIKIQPPEWLLRGVLERNAFALIFGDPGCGKSFLAIDWACRVATGAPWRGRAVKGGPVIYVAGEGQQGFGRRIRAWSEHHGVGLDGVPLYLSPAVAMPDPEDLDLLLAAIDTGVAALGKPPVLIVLDTLARNFGGGDENATQDMGRFVMACDALRERYGCTILVVHHTGHADKSRARGAIALKAALDTEYRLTNESGLLLTATKMKEAELPPPLAMSLVGVELPGLLDEDGVQVTSAAVDVLHADINTIVAKIKASGARRGKQITAGLEIARRLVQDAGDGQASVAAWHEACAAAGIKVSTRYSVLGRLQSGGDITVDGNELSLP